MRLVRRTVPENFRPEIAQVQTEHLSLPHRPVAARGGPHPAVPRDIHLANRREATAEIGVLAVELDGAIAVIVVRRSSASGYEVDVTGNDPEC